MKNNDDLIKLVFTERESPKPKYESQADKFKKNLLSMQQIAKAIQKIEMGG